MSDKINPQIDWRQKKIVELYADLKSSNKGLNEDEAKKRSLKYGLNQLAQTKKYSIVRQLIGYFKNPLIIILMIAALISGATGEIKSALIIITMVLLSIILNFYQEHKSNKAAEKISKRLAISSLVLRDRREKEIETKYVMPGDIVILAAGDIVPADGKIISADDFFLNESSLTGESLPVEKSAEVDNNIFSGTNVVSGYGRFLVVKIGKETELGKIAEKMEAPAIANAFEKGINSFGFLILRVIFIIVALIFVINAANGKGVFNSFLFALAVAVGVTPELLPMIMSLNMAKGAAKMTKHGVLVKRLNSIPTFGSMDILATDKTGTLTEDRITLLKHVDVYGKESDSVFLDAYINGHFETGIKSILDKAILDHQKLILTGYKKIEEIPYDFQRKRSSIVYQAAKAMTMVTKGAPEEIFKISTHYIKNGKIAIFNKEARAKAKAVYDNLSQDGLRVLAVASKPIKEKQKRYDASEESDLVLSGFVAFYDPPKADVKETLELMKKYGVEIKILTGDNLLVTKKICEEIGLEVKGAISGEDLNLNILTGEEIYMKAKNATICARLSPSQKERIILELREHGSVVGYLGDGINDAPSLRAADVGISVSNAVDVAKETADIILIEKGLAALMEGVIEGRRTFANTMKYLLMSLSSNFGNMFSMIGASLFLPFFPMTAGQILLNNLIYDCSQISIPSDNVDGEYLKKPKKWDMGFLKKYMFTFGPISSLFDMLTFYILFAVLNLSGPAFQAGWFIESLATQTLVIFIIRTKKIPFLQSRPSKYLTLTIIGSIVLGLALIQPFIGGIFGFEALPFKALAVIFLLVILYLITVEGVKQIFYRKITEETA